MTIAETAAQNYQRRREMLARLSPVRAEAKTKARAFQDARSGAADARRVLELVSGLSHVPGFFPTPGALIERIVEAAGLEPGQVILEPSAGKGDIASALVRLGVPVTLIQCVEINHTLAKFLQDGGYYVRHADFLTYDVGQLFDRVLMNPPFERGVDEKHIRHAFEFLRPGGRLVAIACATTGRKLEPWARELGGYVEPLPAGSFAMSDRPTQVNTSLIVLER